MRALSRERKIFLACLWLPALMLVGWDLLPIPAAVGRWMMLDKVQPQRSLPAVGFLNMAIVMLVLSAPEARRSLSLFAKLTMTAAVIYLTLTLADFDLGNYFTRIEIVFAGAWLSVLAALMWDLRRKAFVVAALVPSIYFFGLINPVSRGIGAVTNSQMFQFVEAHKELRKEKWLVFAPNLFFGVFAACGLNSYVGMHYLPKIDDFRVFQAHGVDTRDLNNGGMLVAKPLEPGRKSAVWSPIPGLEEWSVSPADPLLRELGIRYVAFDHSPEPALAAGLRRLSESSVSGFWLYELQ